MEFTCGVRSQKSCLMLLKAEETQDLSNNPTIREGVMLSEKVKVNLITLWNRVLHSEINLCTH